LKGHEDRKGGLAVEDSASGPKIGFFGPMKDLSSAQYDVEILPTGQIRARIEHAPMAGVTPQMMRWWFEHIDEFTHYNGVGFDGPLVQHYRLWHPYDHIRVNWSKRVRDAEGRLAPGSIIEIEENLGGIAPVRAKARVLRFDDSAFNFAMRPHGPLEVGVLLHEYAETREGCSFYTEMLVGFEQPLVRNLLNPWVRRLLGGVEFIETWILHNIEESGETEKFVPKLYAHALEGTEGTSGA